MLVVDYHCLNTFQRNVDDVFNLVEALVSCVFTPSLLKVEPQIFDTPFRTMVSVVLICFLLDGNICQMHGHVVHFRGITTVLFIAKSSKA